MSRGFALDGIRVLVTGASSGIGAAIAAAGSTAHLIQQDLSQRGAGGHR
jgi:NAD(P)-dependent dehydrogenase (short-subunit alcohol dehydrogenase family)